MSLLVNSSDPTVRNIMANGKTTSYMAMENWRILMRLTIKVSSKMELNMVKDVSSGMTHLEKTNSSATHKIALDQGLHWPYSSKTMILIISKNITGTTTESGKTTKCMEMDISSIKMGGRIPVNSGGINHTVKEYLRGLPVKNMKDNGSMESKMVRVP